MKTKKAIPVGLFLLTFVFLVLAFLAPFGEEKWRSSTVYEGEASFVQMEIVDGDPVVAFSTSDGIVMAERKSEGGPFAWLTGEVRTSWNRTVISSDSLSGFYLSMKENNGEIAIAHQYSGLGNRKLGYTHRVNGSWVTEQVDSNTGSGIEPGMYASLTRLNDKPVIFYHTAEGDKFIRAQKTNGTWKRKILSTNTGQFISTDSCGEQVKAIYRSRESKTIHAGELTESGWESRKLSGDTDSATSVDADNCEFRGAFLNTDTGDITYIQDGEKESVAPGKLSRLSLEVHEGPDISYYYYGKGLYYAEKNEGEWKTELLQTNQSYAGEYNDLEITPRGNPAIAYTGGSKVVYTEHSSGISKSPRRFFQILTLLAAIPAMLSILYLEEELLLLKSKLFKQFRT